VYTLPDGRTTRVPELLGQTLLEAMACGRPTICTEVASLPELVVHRETGYVVPPGTPAALGSAVAALRANPEEAGRLGANGRTRVLDRFRWDSVVDRCLSAYVEM
jgi:glycosyltransferase involved in cell wall biosynthesis